MTRSCVTPCQYQLRNACWFSFVYESVLKVFVRQPDEGRNAIRANLVNYSVLESCDISAPRASAGLWRAKNPEVCASERKSVHRGRGLFFQPPVPHNVMTIYKHVRRTNALAHFGSR